MSTPSKYQQAIYDFVSRGKGNAIVDAKAGSGKTTTIVAAANLIPTDKRCVFLAFNKSIAEELKSRLPKHVEARTLNSLGHAAWMKRVGRPNLDADKVKKLVRALNAELEARYQQTLSEAHLEAFRLVADNYSALLNLVRKAKVAGIAPADVRGVRGLVADTEDNWLALADHYDIDMPANAKGLIAQAREVLRRSVLDLQTIDFDDQFYMSLIYDAAFPKFDFVFVDEAQDVSDIQREILKRALKANGRIIAVGDPNQSIYGFRGSNPESLALIAKDFNCITLPLSISYRCSKAVIAVAQETVPSIEASPMAPEGEVKSMGDIDDKFDFKGFQPTDMVVCRFTAPLIRLAYACISHRVACKVKGRDIAEGLLALVDKLSCRTVDRLVEKLNEWEAKECRRMTAKDPDADCTSVIDKADSLREVIKSSTHKTVEALRGEIQTLFTDNGQGVLTLSTIHKSKGLEAERVWVLGSTESNRATKAWAVQQERNLTYVAVTRAKMSLFFFGFPAEK